jgi:hypothetical protein
MRCDPPPSVDPSVLGVTCPREAVAGSSFDLAVVIRNLGTVAASNVRCTIEASDAIALTLSVAADDGAVEDDAVVVVPALAPGRILHIRGHATVAGDAPSAAVAIRTALRHASGVVASVVRTIEISARRRTDAEDVARERTEHDGVCRDAHDDVATITAGVAEAVPGVPIAWTIAACLAGGSGDDYAVELHALGCEIERGSVRAIVGETPVAIPTTRRGGSLLARVAALCALDRLVLVCEGIVASPHVAGAAIAVEATVSRGDRTVSARTTLDVRSAPRFANIPEAIAPLDPLVAGTTARVAFALVNLGTATAHGVRISGSVEGVDGASFALPKTSRDEMTPARTELIEGRLVLPAPVRDGTLVTLTATVAANGTEPTAVRRVLAVRSFPAFTRTTSRVAFLDGAPLRPNAARTVAISLANEGTDRADDVRLELLLPAWLRCADRAGGAELAWIGGSVALPPLAGIVETHAAFADAELVADCEAREPDETIGYRLTLANTGDGACRELRIRIELTGPAAYARGSFAINDRRVRDVENASAAFREGIVVEDVPVGATVTCTWRCCVDTDLASADAIACRAVLAWDLDEARVVAAAGVAVVPSPAFPAEAAALPARVAHAAIARAPVPIEAERKRLPPPATYDSRERARLRCDHLEGSTAVNGLVAVLDLRLFLPFAADDVRDDDAARIAAIRAFVRVVDRLAIGVRLGVTLLRSDAIVTDELRAAFARYRSDLRDATLGALLRFVLDEFGTVESGAEAYAELEAYRTALRGLVAWWSTREEEIADLLAAELPPATAAVRSALVEALTRRLNRAVA